ncbi:cryptochrome DASH, partial [Tribonema minus]
VFTHFRKAVESRGAICPALAAPSRLRPLPPSADGFDNGAIPSFADLKVEPPVPDARAVLPFQGGESAGLERVKSWIWDQDCLRSYKETRNGMVGGDYSSKFSSWLAFGCLSPRLVYQEIKRYETERVANESTYWLVFELLWRDYFRFAAATHGNKIFFLGGPQVPDSVVNLCAQHPLLLNCSYAQGQTGYPFIDANMRELRATGFMSNRGRQNVASFLVRDMGQDWRLGAEWFEEQLLDYDPCSNWGNWTYAAGVGADPREDRYFNIVKQGKTYDPTAEHARLWCPEVSHLAPALLLDTPARGLTASDSSGVCYPPPIVPLKFSAYKGSSSNARPVGRAGDHREFRQGTTGAHPPNASAHGRGEGRTARGGVRDKIKQERRGARRNRVQNDYMGGDA